MSHSAGETGMGHITTSKNKFKFLEHCRCVQDNVFTLYVAYEYVLIVKKNSIQLQLKYFCVPDSTPQR